jgi:ribosomal-protein-alanine N-acetyltransferase
MSRLWLRIRNFKDEDIEMLGEIDRICFADDISFSSSELLFQIHHPKSITRVGEGFGRVLGFVIARVDDASSCAHVLTLDVLPDVRRRGIGMSLMTDLHGMLAQKSIKAAVLEVSFRNLPAQRLYESLKYRYLETLHGFYQGREDAYRMVKILP